MSGGGEDWWPCMDLPTWQPLLGWRELLEFSIPFPRPWSERKKAKGFELSKQAQRSECKDAPALLAF